MATNPGLKKAHATGDYSPEMVMEIKRCRKDPIHFINNYVTTQHPTRGKVPFKLYEYQERFVKCLLENRLVITLMARQQGKTLTAAIFLLWQATFKDNQTLLIASKNMRHATEIAGRIRFAYEELPAWLKCGVKYYNRTTIEFDNGSRIICEATTENTGRGLAISRLFLDELAFIPPRVQDLLWASLTPTLSTGGGAIITSTPNGDTELFAQLWHKAMENGGDQVGPNGYYPFRVHWYEHPERGPEYLEAMMAQLGALVARQEVLGEFLSTDALLINSIRLGQLKSVEPLFEDMGFKFWEPPENIGGSGKTYLVGVDPATGNGSDFSGIEVFEFPSLKQVAEWRSNEINVPLLYAKIKWVLGYLAVAKQGNGRGRADVIWSFERNGIGEALVALLLNDPNPDEHADLYCDSLTKQGVFTTGQHKINTCIQLKTFIERVANGMTVKSQMLIHELKNFVAKGNTYDHKAGTTGDMVSATLVVMRLLKRLSEYDEEAFTKVNEYVTPDSPDSLFSVADDEGLNLEDSSEFDNEPFPMMIF